MLSSFIQGMLIGAGLIVAIGAQNAFVLSCGIRRQHRFSVASLCAVCDMVLIFVGTASTGTLVAMNPVVRDYAAGIGALFLFVYGCKSLYSAIFVSAVLEKDKTASSSLKKTLIVTLSLTLLNPHVYLDTVLLLGSIAGQHGETGKYVFALGASVFSWLWFYGLALGGTWLAQYFEKPMSWRLLDTFVCCTMWFIAYKLIMEVIS